MGNICVNSKVKVTSLANAGIRRSLFEEQNPRLNFEFVDAIDGRESADHPLARELFDANLSYTPGARGVAMTTYRLWTEIAQGDEIVTIAEDDAIFRSDFNEFSESIFRQYKNCVHFVAWGYNFDSIVRMALFDGNVQCCTVFDQDAMRNSVDNFLADRRPVSLFRLMEFYGLCAYSISPVGAKFLLERCFPLKNENYPAPGLGRTLQNYGIDIVMNQYYHEMLSYVSFPPLAISRNEHESSSVQTNG
ncbi:glycosyltransferase family 25 protein [Paraburkholderia tropica]|uniref:glycosyltransferase family 25 protein n=1 Tax=Paraburkholderia tropica TaxID=92647 RepID=UPI0030197186